MTPELQALKDNAKRVASEEKAIAADDTEKWWHQLLVVAERELAPVWEYTGKVRPASFSAQTMEQSFEVRIPGHHPIFAIFRGRDFNDPEWWRGIWSGSTFRDGETAWWMVSYPEKNRYMTYHHTLGAAMLAAEIKRIS